MSDRSPSPIPAISDGAVEAAVRAFFCAAPDEDENEFAQCYIDSMRAAISAAILADREEQCIDIESLKAENADLVKLSRASVTAVEAATETITHLRAEVDRMRRERDKAYLAASLIDHPKDGEVYVVVSGFTGSGKSGIAGEIEIALRAIGVPVEWPDGQPEKNMTHADWQTAIELYNPRVVIVERNITGCPR